jgi:Protein of unknown function (DUF2997)
VKSPRGRTPDGPDHRGDRLAAGQVTAQTRGYAGSDCSQASKFLEQALGVTTAERKARSARLQTEQPLDDLDHDDWLLFFGKGQ